jgi:ankyrin repeat protein
MEWFQYKPINLEGRSFRLVRLLRAENGPVQCELFDAWLDDEIRPEYEALSYTWGNTQKLDTIKVNGKMMAVTENLSLGLQNLRYHHQDRILWIDAICIDQTNHKERGHQVLQMAMIYKKAEQVFVWLGPATELTDAFFDCMSEVEKEAVNHVCRDWKVSDKRWLSMWKTAMSTMDRQQMISGSSYQQCWGLQELLTRAWFDRVWIIQEVANARIARVSCGAKSVSARIFALSPVLLDVRPSPHCQAILDVMPGPTRNYSWWTQSHDLHTLLVKFRGSRASDPRDKIFALLGVSSDGSTPDAPQLDYDQSETEVIQNTITFLLNLRDGAFSSPEWTLSDFLEKLERLGDEVLLWAAAHGITSTVKALLHSGKALLEFQGRSETPLLLALENGHMHVVKLLLETDKTEINVQNSKGQTPLLLALERGYDEIVERILKISNVDPSCQDPKGLTPLPLAAEHEHEGVTKLLLEEAETDVNRPSSNGETPLLLAAQNGHVAVARLLLGERQTDVNLHDSKNRTPLMFAAKEGHITIVEALLDTSAANDTLEDQHGWTALWLAAISGHGATVELLLDYRCKRTDKAESTQMTEFLENELLARTMLKISEGREDYPLCPPLEWAAKKGHSTLVKLFLENGDAQVRQVIKSSGQTLVGLANNGLEGELKWLLGELRAHLAKTATQHWASERIVTASIEGNSVLVGILLDSRLSDDAGENQALWSAAKRGIEPIVRQLLDTGRVDVNFGSRDASWPAPWHSSTPLWQAAFNGYQRVIKLLLDAPNIDLSAREHPHGRTPLEIAEMLGYSPIVQLLRRAENVRCWRITPKDIEG